MAIDLDLEPGSPRESYWKALGEGRLTFQRCRGCGNSWLPAREECPRCWSADQVAVTASGEGRVVSFVVFHTAFSPEFKDRLPYNVAIVELAEGPRLITNLVWPFDREGGPIDRRCRLVIQVDHGHPLPRFAVVEAGE